MVKDVHVTDATRARRFEWPTLTMLTLCYAIWAVAVFWVAAHSPLAAIVLLIPTLALHSSLQHEVLHILEPRSPRIARALVFPALGLFIPYCRFRDTHLAHHQNEYLTDPLDDPESYYLLPEIWETLPRPVQTILVWNNTLAGRMILGPLIGHALFVAGDAAAAARGDRVVIAGWLWHIPALACVAVALWLAPIGGWAYLAAAYGALSVLKIRTFLEHRAEEQANGRSVIIEDRGPLAWLFLNNNYHAAHHAHPKIPWYALPAFFRANRDKFLAQNRGYYFPNYAAIFAAYGVRPKEPVAHPLWSLKNRNAR